MDDIKIMTDTLKIKRAITGLTEWQKHVQTGSDIDRDISVAVEVLKAQLDTDVPDTNVGDTISRQAAIKDIKATDWYSQNQYKDMEHGSSSVKEAWYKAQDVYNVLEGLPSVQSKIIHCKDCRYWDTSWQNDYAPDYHYCPMIDRTRRSDFYCADAERKRTE